MDNDEEFLSFSDDVANPSSPILPGRKLKRLKKVASDHVPEQCLPATLSKADDESAPTHSVSSPGVGYPETSGKNGEDFDGPDERTASPLKSFEWGHEFDSIINGPESDEKGNAVESDSVDEEIGGRGEDGGLLEFDSSDEKFGGEGDDGESTKKRRRRLQDEFDEPEEDSNKKKQKKKKKRVESSVDNDGFDNLPFSIPLTKTERRARLTELRVESQRLLRGTGEASFKPAPLVRKPVSSLLEKIRQRKLEVLKRSINVKETSIPTGDKDFQTEAELDFHFENTTSGNLDGRIVAKAGIEGPPTRTGHLESNNPDIPIARGSKDFSNQGSENLTSPIDSNVESRKTFRAPVNDTEDLSYESQTIDSKVEAPESGPDEVAAPPLLSLNLELGTAPPDEIDSDEEDNEKENIDPCLHRLAESSEADPMRAFIDEEAEEEDDSDNDISRFKDDEEDLESMDSDELNDIIATGYEEKPLDNEMRNQLHQQWLEQQDHKGTEKLMQKLKFRPKNAEMAVSEEKDEEGEEEEEEDEDADETTENHVTQNVVRSSLKKAKEMICQMFTEKDDMYVSSDEETEERFAKQQFSDRAEQQGTFLSPAEDEGSKEIFGLIKKLNHVQHTRKKPKVTSYFHALSIGGNGSIPSKSSFVGRGARNSLTSSGKHGSTNTRSFVFERDNSNNSRSAISTSKDSSDAMQTETRQTKTASARICSTQITCSSQNSQTRTNPGPSLHEILRAAPPPSSHSKHESGVGQVEAIYAAFRVDQKLIKKERNVSIRTV